MKRRLLAESDEEETSRAPSRGVEKTKPPAGAAKGVAVSGPAAAESSVSSSSPFLQLLQKCGLSLSKGASSAHSGDSGAIRVVLERELRHYDVARMTIILAEMKAALRQPAFLLSSLQPIASAGARAETQSVHLGARDESLVKLLLNVSSLQLTAMETLLEQMPLLQHQSLNPEEPLSLLRLALAQFRWLDITLVDPQGLATKLVELLTNSPDTTLQREVITLIPDIIDDSTQGVYVEALTSLAAADSSMRLIIIDTLSNLNLAAKFHEDIRRLGLDALHAARDDEICVIIRFIMQSADSVEALRPLMRELRLNVLPTVSNLPPGAVVEAIKNGFRDNRHAVTAFLKELGSLGAGDARPIDVWFLIALLSLAHHRKAGESALKKLAGAQLLTARILREAIVGHSQTLQPYFSVLLNLASRFIRSAENSERELGVELAVLCFRQFTAAGKQVGYHQQEVIATLVGHVGSSVRAEVGASLSALSRLCTEEAAAVTSYASTLKGILEYLDTMTDSEVCRTFELLSRLSLSKDKRSAEIADALEMLIHKQLGSSALRERRMGILGAVAILRLPATTPDLARRAQTILAQLLLPARRARALPHALEFAYDELVAVGKERGALAEQIKAALSGPFQEVFLVFPSDDSVSHEETRWWNELPTAPDAVVNIMPLLQNNEKRPELIWFAAQWRLLMSCTSEADRVEHWAAVVGCPLEMFSREHLAAKDFSNLSASAQSDICAALFYAHSWFRELLNAFTPVAVAQPEMRRFLIARLSLLPELESTLNRLAATCSWCPPSGEEKPLANGPKRGRRKSEEDKPEENSLSLERYFRPLDPAVAPLLMFCSPEQEQDNLHTQRAPPPTAGTAALRSVIAALLTPLAPPPSTHAIARKPASIIEQDIMRRLPPPVGVITDCVVPVLPSLRAHCTRFLQELKKADDDEKVALLSVLSLSFLLIERSLILSASDAALQRKVLAAWTGTEGNVQHVSREELEGTALADFTEWAQRVRDLSTAVSVLNAALALDPLTSPVGASARRLALRAGLSKLAETLLTDADLAKAKAKPEHLRLLLSVFVRYSDQPLNTLFHLASDVLPSCAAKAVEEAEGGSKEDLSSPAVPFLTLTTFPIFYRACLQELALAAAALTKPLEGEAGAESLGSAAQAANTFQALIELLRAHHSIRTVQSSALRYGKAVVEAAIRWFPALSQHFATHAQEIQPVVKSLQQGARPLQNLCADGKAKKDAALVALVPLTRKSLETLVYKVKALCAAHALDKSAYRILNLRQRTVAGVDVSSQPMEEPEPAPKRKRKSKKKDAEEKEKEGEENGNDEEKEDKEEKEKEQGEARSGAESDSDSSIKVIEEDEDELALAKKAEEQDDEEEEEEVESPKKAKTKERKSKRVLSDDEGDV